MTRSRTYLWSKGFDFDRTRAFDAVHLVRVSDDRTVGRARDALFAEVVLDPQWDPYD